ncbi:hypothetical protein F5Y13DRAFT_157431 [Hypoxylon sp. FL1857]|nr:hypothetical protein F5Y13DRAFT_157431 [Hypoxylon sp. FL1857]
MSSPSNQNTSTQKQTTSCLVKNTQAFKSSMDDTEGTKNKVRCIYKKKVTLPAAAGQLGSVFNLSKDPLIAQQRVQGLLAHSVFIDAMDDFSESYLKGRWDLPVGEWGEIRKLVEAHIDDVEWTQGAGPDTEGMDVNYFYARFVIRTLHGIKQSTSGLAYWLQVLQLDEAAWVLTHTLMYLQLDCMRAYKKYAPLKDRIGHFIDTWRAGNAGLSK